MKKSIKLLLLLVLLLIIPINIFAEVKNSDEIITGKYQYSAIEGSNKQNQNTFLYKDNDFTKSSFLGSKTLEVLSIQVAGASLSWYGPNIDKYEIDYSKNDYNIKNFLNEMKFKDVESNKYYNLEKKENSVGVIIGHKTIIQDGKTYTLLAIIPRSAGYKQEWVGNFTIGDGDVHEGFKSARDEILRFTKKYIEKNNIKGNLKVWTSGYSRGAAISNMVGGFFAGGGIDYFGNNVKITPEDVYCYTIGTPSSIKNGVSKNTELSVSANRTQADYKNDTEGKAFNYTKGGTVNVNDSVYDGIRNIIFNDDAFSLLPPENWEFTRYGKRVDPKEGLYSNEEMLKELKSISQYVYDAYTTNGKINEFSEKKFDLKTLSISNKNSNVSQIDFFKDRLNGLVAKIGTNKIYYADYQEALKAAIGTYGMSANLIDDIKESSNLETSEMIYPLLYTYLAYASDEIQSEGRANNELDAITIAIEDLLTYFTGENIDKDSFTIDDFVKLFAKYMSDNENEPISDVVVSGIVNLIPEEQRYFLSMLNVFSVKGNDSTPEESLKAFIKACYSGPADGSQAFGSYESSKEVRSILYLTMNIFSERINMPEIQFLITSSNGTTDGHGKFKDLIDLLLTKAKEEKDDKGTVINTYTSINELADSKLNNLLDSLLLDSIEKSEKLYGKEYKVDYQKQFNNMKQNITKVREIISALFFYTEGGYNVGETVENTITFIQNASLIAMPHFDELYLAYARTSNRYDDEYECIKGNDQVFNLSRDDKLTLTFSFDHYLFLEHGIVYIDGKEVSKDNYSISKGSTIITLNNSYVKTLSEGKHTMTLKMDGKEAEGTFTISKEANGIEKIINPKTGDNIFNHLSILIISIICLIGSVIYINKKILKK